MKLCIFIHTVISGCEKYLLPTVKLKDLVFLVLQVLGYAHHKIRGIFYTEYTGTAIFSKTVPDIGDCVIQLTIQEIP